MSDNVDDNFFKLWQSYKYTITINWQQLLKNKAYDVCKPYNLCTQMNDLLVGSDAENTIDFTALCLYKFLTEKNKKNI